MHARFMTALALNVAIVCPAVAQPAPQRSEAGVPLSTESIIDAPVERVWEAMTTKAGWESWAVPLAEVDFRVGGTIKATYNKEEGIGGPGTITHHVLAYEPLRMYALKTDAPANAPDYIKEICRTGWWVCRFEPIGTDRTRVIETGMGFLDTPLHNQARKFFEVGNRMTFDQLKKKFPPKPGADPEKVLGVLGRMVGGEWIHEKEFEGGKVFRARNILEAGPDGKSIVGKGFLGGADGMFFHGATTIYLDGPSGTVRFTNIDQDGSISMGPITLVDDNSIRWDWVSTSPKGETHRYDIVMRMDGADAYRMFLSAPDAAADLTKPGIDFKRVTVAPDRFRKLRSGAAETSAQVNQPAVDAARFAASGPSVREFTREITVKATPAEVYRLWTTSEGFKEFTGLSTNIELRPGGPFEIYFGADQPEGKKGSEGCQVLAYIPNQMFAFTWNAPPKFAAERELRTWVIMTFEPVDGGSTRVKLVHAGFGESGEWPQVREYFMNAWPMLLKATVEKFASK